MQKVGAFLEKKTSSDVWRARIGYVRILPCTSGALEEHTVVIVVVAFRIRLMLTTSLL